MYTDLMAFEREKHAAVTGPDSDPGEQLTAEDRERRERDERRRRDAALDAAAAKTPGRRTGAERAEDDRRRAPRLEPGRRTLAEEAVSPPTRDFRGEAMADVVRAVSAVARGERAGDPTAAAAMAPAMVKVAEARAVTLHRHAVESGEVDAHDPAVDESLRRVGGGGQALPTELKRQMEDEFGVSFDRVRVHTDAVAAEAARAIRAEAFTVGEDIFFAQGAFSPGAHRLVAHELAHVVQGWQGRTAIGGGRKVSVASDALEHEADAVATRVATRAQRPRTPAAPPRALRASGPAPTPIAMAPAGPARGGLARTAGPAAPAASAGAHLLRKPDSGQGAAPNPNDQRPNPPKISVRRDEAAADQLRHTAKRNAGDAKAELAALRTHMHHSTQRASGHMKQSLAHAKGQHVGAHAAKHHSAHAAEHHRHQEEAHAAAKHAAAAAHAHHHAPPPPAQEHGNPSAHDGVDGIQFKPISDWSKYMPEALPDQDARERQRIQKLVQKKVERERHQSAKELAQLKAAQQKAASSIRAMKGSLQSSIAAAQTAAAGKVAAAESAQAAAVQAAVAGVTASVRAQAAAMKQQVTSAHTQTVQQITQGAQAATQKLQQAHQQALTQMATQEATQHAAVTAAFAATKGQITALGAQKAGEAQALPATIALPYDGDKLDAAKKAAKQVGDSYAEAMPQQAAKAAGDLGGHEPETQSGVTQITTQIQQKLEEAFTQSTQAIEQTKQQAIQAADAAKTAALQQIDQTAASTTASLSSLSAQSVAGIHQQGAAAKSGIASAGQAAIGSVGQAVDKAAHGLEGGAAGLAKGAREIEAPSVEETKKQVRHQGAELSKSVTSISTGLQKTASGASTSLGTQATTAATGMATAAEQAKQQATQVGAQANASLGKVGQGAQQSLQQVAEGATKQLTKIADGGADAFTQCAKGQQTAYTEQIGKLKSGLDGALKNVSDSFNQAVPTKETADILANAKKAADAVKPWWQRALAFVVSIVVAVVVVIAVTALIAVSGPVGMILVGALAGALSTVLSTMASNLILGNNLFEGITLQSVAIGALGGAIGGGIGGAISKGVLGNTLRATMAFEEAGVGGLGGFAIRTATNSAIGMVSDMGAQMIVTGKYDFTMQNLVTTLVTSAATSTKTFHGFAESTGDAVRTSVGLEPLHPPVVDPNASTGTPGSGGSDSAHGGASPTPAPADPAAASATPHPTEPTPAPAATQPAPAASEPAGTPRPADPAAPTGSSPKPVEPTTPAPQDPAKAGAPQQPTPSDPAAAPTREPTREPTATPPANQNEPHPTDPAAQTKPGAEPPGAEPSGQPKPSDPAAQTKPGAEAPGAEPSAPKPADPAAQTKPPADPAAQTKPGAEPPGAEPSGQQPKPSDPAAQTKPAAEPPASEPAAANENQPQVENDSGAGPAPSDPANTAADSALAADGYENPTATKRAAAESELRAGETPSAENLRDTEANARGIDQLEQLEQTMNPEERARFNRELAEKLASEPESTGNLERDIQEVRQQEQREQAAENADPTLADKQNATPEDEAHQGAKTQEEARAELKKIIAELLEKGPISVEDSRRLADMARELGVPIDQVPKASSVADVLRAKGMTAEEIQMIEGTLGKDGQASLKGTADDVAGSHENFDGTPRSPLSPQELAVLLKANILLFEDFTVGGSLTKVVPESGLGDLMHGQNEYGQVGLRNDVGLSRNTEGMTPTQKTQNLGLDYEVKPGEKAGPYTDLQADGSHEVKPSVAEELWQIDSPITQQMADNAKVPLGPDLYAKAMEEAHRYAELKANDPTVEVPKLLQLDADGNPLHMELRVRQNASDPRAGTGYTASQGLRNSDGGLFFSHNQEATLGKTSALPAGAELVRINAQGQREVVATWDGTKFVVKPDAPAAVKAQLEAAMLKTQQRLADAAAAKAAASGGAK